MENPIFFKPLTNYHLDHCFCAFFLFLIILIITAALSTIIVITKATSPIVIKNKMKQVYFMFKVKNPIIFDLINQNLSKLLW